MTTDTKHKRKGKSKPRLTHELTEAQYQKLKLLIPHGAKKKVFDVIIDDLIILLEGDDEGILLGAILRKSISLPEILNIKNNDSQGSEA